MNKSEGTYFSRPGTSPHDLNDTTILSTKAAGSYPFIRTVVPDIDMQLTVKPRRTGDYVEVRFDGFHDQFPAYELVVDNVRRQRWEPVAHGQTGPNPINLHANYWGTQVRTSFTMYQRLPPRLPAAAPVRRAGPAPTLLATLAFGPTRAARPQS